MYNLTITGALVKKDELRTTSNGNKYIRISIARNYSERQDDGSYKDIGQAFFENLTLWGKTAECFAQSEIPLGSPLIVTGYRVGVRRAPYINAQKEEIPERFEEEFRVTGIGALIEMKRKVIVQKAEYSNNNNNNYNYQQSNKPAPQAQPSGSEYDMFATAPSNEPVNQNTFENTSNTDNSSIDTDSIYDDIFSV